MYKVRFEGKKEIEKRVKALMMETDADNIASKLYTVAAEAAKTVADEIKQSAQSKKVPRDILKDIFSTSKPKRFSSEGKRPIAQLAGIKLRGRQKPYAHAYREWRGKHSFTKIRINKRRGTIVNRGTTEAGKVIGMSLATMYEYGTTKMRPRPFVKPAMNMARPKVKTILTEGFKGILEEHTE